jgi:hypothetical protein
MNHIDQLPFGFSLPILSDEAAGEVHNFLEMAIQIFEARYNDELERYYMRQDQECSALSRPKPPS